MFSANVVALGLAALKGTETEQRICVLLFDDNFQVISSFELNQMASLTYHEGSIVGELDMTEKMLEYIEAIVSKPADYSPLTVEKALAVTKHILIFGASKAIRPFKAVLGKHIDALQQYNTALLAQQQTGAAGLIMRLKGGAVDKGGPSRELATVITRLLSNDQALLFERNTQADPNSLVPIGSRKQVAFVSDDARLRYLKKKMEHEKLMNQRSNLAKANDGFGAGYMSRDGKSVVGAAHGIDEMIRQAQREEQKFTDGGYKAPSIDVEELRQYAKEFEQQYGNSGSGSNEKQQSDIDLFDSTPQNNDIFSTNNNQQVDLLDFGSTSNGMVGDLIGTTTSSGVSNSDIFGLSDPYATGHATTGDLLGNGTTISASTTDIFGLADPYASPSPAVGQVSTTADLLSTMSLSTQANTANAYHNPAPSTAPSTFVDPFASPIPPPLAVEAPPKKAVMSSNEDRFAALDLLGQSSTTISATGSTTKPVIALAGLHTNSIGADSFAGIGDTRQTLSSNNISLNSLGGLSMSSTAGNTGGLTNSIYGTSESMNPLDSRTSLNGLTSPSMMLSSLPSYVSTDLSSIQVSKGHMPAGVTEDDIASGFVMGGTAGSGLEPVGTPPAAPPPPPPPASYW